MIELPSGGVVHSAVSVRADAFLLQQVLDIIGVLEQFCLVGGLHHDGADDRLNRRHSWRKHETLHTHTMIITHDNSKNTVNLLGFWKLALSSPCTITVTPMVLVVSPHEVCQGIAFSPCSSSYWILNILPKFCPRLWLVAPCIARPCDDVAV